MCGILLHKGNKNITSSFLSNLDKLSHRGPDSKSHLIYKDIYIGHTRLSIIDLSELGNQPMVSNCGNYILSFNGEIYNFNALKLELEDMGYIFNSSSDSEVLLYGFIQFKEKILDKLDGIFSFIVVDKKNDSIFFARDNFGVKPLYYSVIGKNLIISSESRVFESLFIKDESSKIMFLSHGYIPSPKTIYKNVYSLLPGHYGVFKNDQLEVKNYFNLLSLFRNNKNNFDSNLISKAVKSQLISDAKLGCFFSGGLDSSVLAYEANKLNDKIETYSVNFLKHDDESNFQKALINSYNIKNKELKLSYKDFESNIDGFMTAMDQPTIDGFNTFFISNFVKKNSSKVVLSGLGADEIFYGYPIHRNYQNIHALKNIKSIIPTKFLPNKYRKLEYLNLDSDYGIYLSQRGIFSPTEISQILDIKQHDVIEYLNQNIIEDKIIKHKDQITKISYFEMTKYMEGQLLRDSDVFGMANSIEIRVPFLSKELVEAALSINYKYKLNNNINKPLLALKYKNILPSEIYKRKKQGFELPYKKWLIQSGIIKNIISSNKKLSFLSNAHWSKIWAINIMKNKF
jgi:asparagine synthase (glutamine-hydrolysing)